MTYKPDQAKWTMIIFWTAVVVACGVLTWLAKP